MKIEIRIIDDGKVYELSRDFNSTELHQRISPLKDPIIALGGEMLKDLQKAYSEKQITE